MAPVKRKSSEAELPSAKATTKRPRTDARPEHSRSTDQKSTRKIPKQDKDSSEPTKAAPISFSAIEQPAFPRGGGSLITPIERKQIEVQATRDALKEHASSGDLFTTSDKVLDQSENDDIAQEPLLGSQKTRKKTSKKNKLSDSRIKDDTSVRIEGLSYKRIVPGSLILGQITSINSLDIAVALPNNLTGYVPLSAISRQFTAKIESIVGEKSTGAEEADPSDEEDEIDLKYHFRVGQYVRTAVTSTEEASSRSTTRIKKHIELSLDPKLSNAGLNRSNIAVGCTVQVSIVSVEDHGLIADLGFDDQTTGFISAQELGPLVTPSSIKTGAVMLCIVTGLTSNSRTIKLSADQEKLASAAKPLLLSTAPTIDAFLPGTAVEVLLSDVNDAGLTGNIMGMLDVTADIVHSGAATGVGNLNSKYKAGAKVKGRLICTFPSSNTRKVGFSVLENVLGLQSLKSPNGSDEGVSISSIVPDAEVVKVEPGLGVYLKIRPGLPKAFVHISRLSDTKVDSISQTSGPFKFGSKHTGRVLDFSPLDNLYIMSLQEKVVKQAFLRMEDVKVGDVVKGKIEKLLISESGVTGLIVEISEGVTGLVPELHFSDIILEHPEKKFREGLTVSSRVLSTDTSKRQIRLTLKKSLVNSDQPIWADFAQIAIGDTTPGTLVKVDARGAVVQFYGSVKGFLPVSEMSEAYIPDAREHFRRGQVVTVNAISVDAEAERLTVSCRDPSASNSAFGPEIAALIPGVLASGTVFEKSQDDILLRLDKSNVVARLHTDHVTDGSTKKRKTALEKIRVGQHLQDLLVLEVQTKRKAVTLCNRPSLIKASRDGSLLKRYDELKEGKLVTGFVSNITPVGAFVSFAAGICGLIPKAHVPVETEDQPDFGLSPLQPVTTRVMSIDYRGPVPRFWLTMREGVTPRREHAEENNLVNQTELIDAVDGVSKVIEDFSVGKITKARIVSVKETQINVELAKGLQGRIDVSELFDTWDDIKDRKRPLRVFSTSQVLSVRILGAHDTRTHKFLPITHRAGKSFVYELTAKPSLLREPNYEILTMKQLKPQSSWLAFVNNIGADYLWVNISPAIRGRIRAVDVSDDLSLAANLEENFPLGSALRVRVMSIDVEKNRLDLTARSTGSAAELTMKDISVGMILPGRVTKTTDRQVLVQMSDSIVGAVDLIDMADDYTESDPEKYKKHDIIRVCVVHVDAPNKRIKLSTRPSKVLSSSLTVKDPEITSAQQLNVNDVRRGFVSNVDDKGIFVTLGHNVTAYVRVTNLSDSYLKEWKDHFHRDQLVEGKIIFVDEENGHVQMSLKASMLKADYVAPLTLIDVKVGDIVSGKVAQVKDFGVFIVVDNSLNVRGLCHRSEIAEQRIEDASKLFSEGDAVKAKVLSVDVAARKINFGLKASYFAENEDDDGQKGYKDSEDDEDPDHVEGGVFINGDRESNDEDNDSADVGSESMDSEDELLANDIPAGVVLARAASVPETSEDADGLELQQKNNVVTEALSVGGFNWAGGNTNGVSERALDPSDIDDQTVAKPKKRKRAEIQIDRTGDLDRHGPQSADDFERQLLGEPDSAILWLEYMGFHLELGEIDQVRHIGERAIKTIGLGQDAEKLKIWAALLSLENVHGTDARVEETFRQACEHNDPQEVYNHLASIYIQSEKLDKAEELFQTMLKKFGQDPKTWINYATFLFDKAASAEKARQLLPRALQTLPQFTHVRVTSKFAQLEFQSPRGNAERGRTIFEGLLDSFPRRMDLWNVYLDMEQSLVRKGVEGSDQVRQLYTRIFAGKIKNKQAQVMFKKWLALEEEYGDERSVDEVKAKAAEFVRNAGKVVE